jgi:hypothetical protein
MVCVRFVLLNNISSKKKSVSNVIRLVFPAGGHKKISATFVIKGFFSKKTPSAVPVMLIKGFSFS